MCWHHCSAPLFQTILLFPASVGVVLGTSVQVHCDLGVAAIREESPAASLELP